MNHFFDLNWKDIFSPSVPLLEILIRGSLTYLALFLLLRLVLKREAGTVGMADLLMVVLIADAAQNGMAANFKSVTDSILLVGTIIFWNYTVDWMGYHFPWFQRHFVSPPPLCLVKKGEILHRNMRRELITKDELMSQLRQQGVKDLSEVKEAFMEGNGRISVITHQPNTPKADNRSQLI